MNYTNYEKQIIRLNRLVPLLDKKIYNWALEQATPKIGVLNYTGVKDSVFCIKCDRQFERDSNIGHSDFTVCPHCGEILHLRDYSTYNKGKDISEFLFCTVGSFNHINLIRTYRVKCTINLNLGTTTYRVTELCRHWINDKGESAVTALPRLFGKFIYAGYIRLRRKNRLIYDYFADIAQRYYGEKENHSYFHPQLNKVVPIPNESSYSFIMSTLEQNSICT